MSDTSEQATGTSRGMTRVGIVSIVLWWAVGAAAWGAVLWKLGAATARPSPMRWISFHDADGTKLGGRVICHGTPFVHGRYMWRTCDAMEAPRAGSRTTLYRFDLENQRATAVRGIDVSFGLWAAAPRDDGALTTCGMKGCAHVEPDRTAKTIPEPGTYVGIAGMAWVSGELQVVMRSWGRLGAKVRALRGESWVDLATSAPKFDQAEEVRLELAYRHGEQWQLLFSRAPKRLDPGNPVPVTLYVAQVDSAPQEVARLSLAKTWTKGFVRGYDLPLDRTPGNRVEHAMLYEREWIHFGDAGGWRLDSTGMRDYYPAYVMEGARLRRLSASADRERRIVGKDVRLRWTDSGTHVVEHGGTVHPAFTSNNAYDSQLLPRPRGGAWAIDNDNVAILGDDLRRVDPMSFGERWSMLQSKFDRFARYSDYFDKARTFKISSFYVMLFALPLAWLVAAVWYRRFSDRTLKAIRLCIACATVFYLSCALLFGGEYLGLLKRL